MSRWKNGIVRNRSAGCAEERCEQLHGDAGSIVPIPILPGRIVLADEGRAAPRYQAGRLPARELVRWMESRTATECRRDDLHAPLTRLILGYLSVLVSRAEAGHSTRDLHVSLEQTRCQLLSFL